MHRASFDRANRSRPEEVLNKLPVLTDDGDYPFPSASVHAACIAVPTPCPECLVAIAIEPPCVRTGGRASSKKVERSRLGIDPQLDDDRSPT